MFGLDDSLKVLKKEWKDVGVDMSIIRGWQKYYDKVIKQAPILESQYQTARVELKAVLAALRSLEQSLIIGDINATLENNLRDLKKYQGHFHHEFLISKEDADFHSTYDSILRLCEKGANEKSDALILQSEVENLIALATENLDKKWPDSRAMAYFYIERSDKELVELPHADKVEKVQRIYESEFLKPLRECLTGWLREERVKEIMEEELWKY